MCEIAVVNPDNIESVESFLNGLPKSMYKTNSDGLGIVGVYPDGDSFDYSIYKRETPKQHKIESWVSNHLDAWRFIIHARLATAGGVGDKQCHPLKIVEDSVDAEWVIHNGVVRNDDGIRSNLQDDGNDFHTTVDSEVIAHKHPNIPDDVSEFEESDISGRLNYLLLCDDRILIRNSGKYRITEDFRMSTTMRHVSKDDDYVGRGLAMVKPDMSIETDELPGSYSMYSICSTDIGSSSSNSGSYNRVSYHDRVATAKYKPNRENTGEDSGEINGVEATVSLAETENMLALVVVDNDDEPIENATVEVSSFGRNDDSEVEGTYKTGATGSLTVPKPEGVRRVYFDLVDIEKPVERAEITEREAEYVNWWHHISPEYAYGNWECGVTCDVHNTSHEGKTCPHCIEDFTRGELLGKRAKQ